MPSESKVGATAQNLIVVVKLCLIAALIVAASWQWNNASVWQGHALADRETSVLPSDWRGYVALLAAMSWISLSYTGFNAAVYVAGESKQAQRNVPKAMLWATLIVMAIYVTLNAVFVWSVDTDEVVKAPPTIAVMSAANIGGGPGQFLMRSIVALAVLSSVFSMLMAGPRVYAQMARDGVMPRFLDFTGQVPRVSIVSPRAPEHWGSLVQHLGTVDCYLGMTLSACSALAVAALLKLVGTANRPSAWELAAAVLYVLGTLAMLVGVVLDAKRLSSFTRCGVLLDWARWCTSSGRRLSERIHWQWD